MIPAKNSPAVLRALTETFGTVELDDMSTITKGHTSSLVFRIVVQGSPYLLKIITRNEDPSRHYTCMKAAAEAGIAPPVRYTNIEDQVCITDFVVEQPLAIAEGLARLPGLLRTLHALPPFARAPFNTTCTFLLTKGPFVDGFLQSFRAANLLPAADGEEFLHQYEQLAAVYPYDDAEMVSCHNDLFKPDNMLFDGQHVWLVDWEAAFLNDRYADLAAVANQVVTNEQEELFFLQEYFGVPPSMYQLARFHLLQQLSHLFYVMAFLRLPFPQQGWVSKPIDWSAAAPSLNECHREMWAGKFDLTDVDQKTAYARAHWHRALHNVGQPRYREALRIVSDRRATA